MSDNDTDPITATRRETLQAGTMTPLAFWDDWSIFDDDSEYEILRILNSETPLDEGITQLDFGENLTAQQTGENAVRIDAAASSGGGGGAFEDTDDDGVAELQEDHSDFEGGDARNVGEFDANKQQLNDTETDPSTNGEVRRNGTDVKVFSGGSVQNLSNMGNGAGGVGDVATVTVAASGSSYAADYVCDGTDDHTTINNAINSLPAGGGTVVLSEGQYNLGGAVTDQGKSNLYLRGQGRATHLRVNDSTQTNAIAITDSDYIEISHLRVDGNRANQTDGGDRENQCGIWVGASSTSQGADYVHIHHCWVSHTVYSCIRCRDGPQYVRYVDNYVSDTTQGPSDNVADGLVVSGRNTDVSRCILANNLIEDIGHQPIEISHADLTQVTGNIIWGGLEDVNIHPEAESESGTPEPTGSVVFSNNVIYNLEGHVSLEGPSIAAVGNVLHTLNESQNCALRVGHYDPSPQTKWVTCIGNTLAHLSGFPTAIRVTSDNQIVLGNTIRDSPGDGITIEGSNCGVGFNRLSDISGQPIIDNGSGNEVAFNITPDGSGKGFHVGSSQPSNPLSGAIWFDTS